MKKLFSILIILLSINYTLYPQKKSGIKWYDIKDLDSLVAKGDRPVMIDAYTDWCAWCRHMDKTTFAQENMINYINSRFYAVKFNTEVIDTITFKGKTYVNKKKGKSMTNELANELLDNRLAYPSLVFFDREGKKFVSAGYKKPKDLEYLLVYFFENVGKSASLENFIINYVFSFPKTYKKERLYEEIDKNAKPDTSGVVNWVDADKVLEMSKSEKKPILVYFHIDWCISCKVMDKTSFGNSKVAEILNEHYYPVMLNAATNEDISFLGKTYKGTGVDAPNEIVKAFLNNYKMPAILIFDENHKLLTRLNGYLLSSQLIPLTEFFYKKLYEKMSFQEYLNQR